MTPFRMVQRRWQARVATLAAGAVLATLTFSAAPAAAAPADAFTVTLTGPATATLSQATSFHGTVMLAGTRGVGSAEVVILIDGVNAATYTTYSTGHFWPSLTFAPYGSHTVQAVYHQGDALETRSPLLTVQVNPPTPAGGTSTNIATASAFLYEGAGAPQQGVAAGTITPTRVAVLHGTVRNALGQPLAGVAVSVVGHPEYGNTVSRSDGGIDLAVNGGQPLTVTYSKTGWLAVDRTVDVAWRDFTTLPEVVLTPLDAAISPVDSGASSMQVARGNPVSDADGDRQATLLVPAGTSATMTLPDGSEEYLPALHVRATEVTVGVSGPQAMPAELPAASAYTYAVDYTVDEAIAAGASRVSFDAPLAAYTDNFLNFPTGTGVPAGFYDRRSHTWVASEDGVVLGVVGLTGGKADLDVTGDGVADGPTVLNDYGITEEERTTLAGLYTVGSSMWRVQVSHFTPWDYNYPYGLPEGAAAPDQHAVEQPHDGCQSGGSIIGCTAQTLGEAVAISGTGMALRYDTSRVPGFGAKRSVNIGLTGATLPPGLRGVTLRVTVAGRTFDRSFGALPNQRYEFVWDGKDVYGRPVQGAQTATVRVGFDYRAVYYGPASVGAFSMRRSFAQVGNAPIVGSSSRAVISVYQGYTVQLGGLLASGLGDVGGWTLSAHHAYDPDSRTLYLGDGSIREGAQLFSGLATIAGTGAAGSFSSGTYSGDGGPATSAGLSRVHGLTSSADGSIIVADTGNGVIRRISPAGIISTIAGAGNPATGNGDGGPATSARLVYPVAVAFAPDGSLLIGDPGANRIRKVAVSGTISTVAGGGTPTDGFGDLGPATSAALSNPQGVTVADDGTVYVADTDHNRIRKISPDGTISTVAGGGTPADNVGDGLPGTQAALLRPMAVAAGSNSQVWIADTGHDRVRRLGSDGLISTVAGTGITGNTGDGGPATQATLDGPAGLAVDTAGSSVFIAQPLTNTIRQSDSHGILRTVAGSRTGGFSGDQGVPTRARFTHPNALALSPTGQLLIADTDNYRIRRISAPLPGFSLTDVTVPSSDGSEVYQFDATGRHLRTLDAITGLAVASFGYNTAGQLTTVADHFSNTTTINRNGGGVPTSIDSPYGQRTLLQLTADGYLNQISNPANETVRMTYRPSGGLMTSYTDALGNVSLFEFDTDGRLARDTAADGKSTSLSRTLTDSGVTVSATTAEGHVTSYFTGITLPGTSGSFGPAGGDAIQTVVTADGLVRSTTRGADGSVRRHAPNGTITVVDPPQPDPRWGLAVPVIGAATRTSPAGITSNSGEARSVTLSDPNNPLSVMTTGRTLTVDGRAVQTSYTAEFRTAVTTTPSGLSDTVVYGADGLVASSQHGTLAATTYTYDPRGRLLTTTTGAGAASRTISYTYNAHGYVETITDPLNRVVRYTRDPIGRVTDTELPGGTHITASFDENGNLTSLTPPGRSAHTFAYTQGDQLALDRPPAFDATDPATRTTYNLDRQPTLAAPPGLGEVSFHYDNAGRLSSTNTAAGEVAFGFDSNTGDLGSVTAPGASPLTFGYDGDLLTSIATGNGVDPVNRSVSYVYGPGQRIASSSITGAGTSIFGYDSDGTLSSVNGLTLARNNNGLHSGSSIGTGATEVTSAVGYDNFGAANLTTAAVGGITNFEAAYTRDNFGRIIGLDETLAPAATSHRRYTFAEQGWLSEVRDDAGVLLEQYTYDENGNRTGVSTPSGTETATFDAQDRLVSQGEATFTYTPRGQLATRSDSIGVTTFTYDVLGHLTQAVLPNSDTLGYGYDGLGRRIWRSVNGVVGQRYLYGAGDRLRALLDGNGAIVATYSYAGRSSATPALIIAGGVTYRVISDHLGSPRKIVNTSTGTVVQALRFGTFGTILSDTNPGFQPFGYTGGLADPDTGLVHLGARDYDPSVGRWTEKDLAGYSASGTNLYTYVGNDPMNGVDPSGLVSCRPGQNGGGCAGGSPLPPGIENFEQFQRQMQQSWDRGDCEAQILMEGLAEASRTYAYLRALELQSFEMQKLANEREIQRIQRDANFGADDLLYGLSHPHEGIATMVQGASGCYVGILAAEEMTAGGGAVVPGYGLVSSAAVAAAGCVVGGGAGAVNVDLP